MCGICGYINLDGRPAEVETLRRMNATIVHRGPDDSGEYISGPMALGHRRLSIIDLARGHQPMSARGQLQQIVYNGEVYNHLAVREELDTPPESFQTTCDTETILVAYQLHKQECLSRLRGMFSFAIYDPDDNSLFLARDRLGIKPLYIYRTANLLAFGSEIKALLAHPEIRAEVNVAKLPAQLTLKYTLDEETLYRGITKLPPGHFIRMDRNGFHMQRYWDLNFTPKERFDSEQDAVTAFRDTFNDAVESRLMADVPLGVFLSGGIDSSVIAAAMSKMVNEPIQSFTVAFAERDYSEFEFSRAVAKHIGAELHEVTVSPEQFFDAWPTMVYHEDEPIAHPSSIPLHFVSKLAAERVKVVLTGEGADELLAGYERYYQTVYNLRYGRLFPSALRPLTRALIDLLPDTFTPKRKAVRTALYLPTDIDTLFLDNYAAFPRSAAYSALRPEYQQTGYDDVYANFRNLMDECDSADWLDKILYADIKTYLLELLMKQDQMSMSASLESRVPFLDHELVEFACRLPREFKLKGFDTKRIIRMALGDTVPEQIVSRSKRGFPTPTKEWFRGGYFSVMEELLLGKKSLATEYINPEFIRETLDRHHRSEWDLQERIWTLGNLEIWLRVCVDGQAPESVFEGASKVTQCA